MPRTVLALCLLLPCCSPKQEDQRQPVDSPPAQVAISGSPVPTDTSPRIPHVDLDSALRAHPVTDSSIDTVLSREIATPIYHLRVPARATLDSGEIHPTGISGLRIRGPMGQSHDSVVGVPYELVVATYPNPGRTPLPKWIDSIRAIANADMDPDSMSYVPPAEPVRLGPNVALLVSYPCGDCGPVGLYFARDTSLISYRP